MHDATRETPFFLVYGRDHYLPLDVLLGLPWREQLGMPAEYRRELVRKLADAFRAAWQCQLEAQERNRFYYNQG